MMRFFKKLTPGQKALLSWCAFLLIVYGALFLMNVLTPLMGEDYAMTRATDAVPFSFDALGRVLRSFLESETYSWTLRLGDKFAALFLALPRFVFNAFSPVLPPVFLALVFYYGNARLPSPRSFADLAACCAVFALFAICSVNLGDTVFWITGCLNYLLPAVLLLALAAPYRAYLSGGSQFSPRKAWISLYVFACFFAAFGNENTTPVIIALGSFLIARDIWNGKKPPLWLPLSSAAFFACWAILAFSPVTRFRTQWYRTGAGLPPEMTLDEIYGNAVRVAETFGESTWPLIAVFLACLALYVKFGREQRDASGRSSLGCSLFLICLSLISALALCFAPYTEARAFLLIRFFLAAGIAYMIIPFVRGIAALPCGRSRLTFAAAVILALCIFRFGAILFSRADYYLFDRQRAVAVKVLVAAGSKGMSVPVRKDANWRIVTREDYTFRQGPGWASHYFARYYGLKGIKGLDGMIGTANGDMVISDLAVLAGKMTVIPVREAISSIDNVRRDDQYGLVEFAGWAMDGEARDEPGAVFVKTGDALSPAVLFPRPDVAAHFNSEKLLQTGFTCHVPMVSIPPGATDVDLYIISKDLKRLYIVPYTNYPVSR